MDELKTDSLFGNGVRKYRFSRRLVALRKCNLFLLPHLYTNRTLHSRRETQSLNLEIRNLEILPL